MQIESSRLVNHAAEARMSERSMRGLKGLAWTRVALLTAAPRRPCDLPFSGVMGEPIWLAARLAVRLALRLAVGSRPCGRCRPVLCGRRQQVGLGVQVTVDDLGLDVAPG